jgi:hypothetical protein
MILKKLIDAGVELKLSNSGENLRVITDEPLTDEQRNFIRINKNTLISELEAANDHTARKVFTWRLEFENGDSMIWRCNFSSKQKAILRLRDQFCGKEIKMLELIN